MVITTRPARAEDKAPCMALLEALAGAAGGSIDSQAVAVFDELLNARRGEIVVAEEDGVVLGMASVSYNLAMRYGGEYCQLEELIVDPAARGRNVGGLLVQTTLERARSRGCGEYGLYLVESTEHNLPFYQKYGFTKVGSELRQALR